ncbi:MAG: hypothetical protein RLZZ528_2564, partial [Pseudomonadota bacterium]
TGCLAPPDTQGPEISRLAPQGLALPAAQSFEAGPVLPATRANAEMTADIGDLVFRMESGRAVPVLSRFEGPITVRMTGPVPPTAATDLSRLMARLRSEAGIDISAATGADASITVEFISRRALTSAVPQAACFVAPGVSSWADYRRSRRSAGTDWAELRRREKATVFIPADTAPQEVRDCLHEEIAQALGPLNDLYRLPDSIFNDDNMHGVLTGFDMLVLRVVYAPELASGMPEAEVRARLPGIIERLNPGGGDGGSGYYRDDTPAAYVSGIATAIAGRAGTVARRDAAIRAANIAEGAGWMDARAGFAHLIVGRILLATDPNIALTALTRAQQIYDGRGMALQSAHVDMQLAAFALSQGDAAGAIARADRAAPVAAAAQNAGLLASLLMVKAEALDLAGQPDAARAMRLDSMGWARYGFGPETEVRARLAEIAALNPSRRRAGP